MVILGWWACVSPSLEGEEVPASEETAAPVDVGPTDEELVRALIGGVGSVGDVLQRVAWSGGWPVRAAGGTWLFVSERPARLAGDHDGWVGVPLREGPGFWWAEVEVPEPAGSGYKLFGEDPAGWADPWARAFLYDEYGRLSLVAPSPERPHLERWPAWEGRGLRARDVQVWVPAGTGPWPVVVVHDGQNLFDPGALWGGWRLGEALGSLEEGVLAVALDNTADRMSEYTHAVDEVDGIGRVEPQGADYADLVVLEVLPWAEARWPADGRRAVMGSSLGGLISLYAAWRHPGVFDVAVSLSGTLGWGRFGAEGPAMEDLYDSLEVPAATALYVDSGGGPGVDGRCDDVDGDGLPEDDPDATDNYCTTRAFADARAAAGYRWQEDLVHWWEPGAAHNEAAWAARVQRPLTWWVGR